MIAYAKIRLTQQERVKAETRKLWKKKDCRDLVVINYRLRGLAADFHKTRKTNLVNSAKVGVRS
jgi:hypothetical protein